MRMMTEECLEEGQRSRAGSSDELIALGALCKLRRKELNLTQGEVAKLAGISSQSAVCRIEKGQLNVTFTSLLGLEAALGIPLLELTREVMLGVRSRIYLDPADDNRNLIKSWAQATLRSHHRAEMKRRNLPKQVGPQ